MRHTAAHLQIRHPFVSTPSLEEARFGHVYRMADCPNCCCMDSLVGQKGCGKPRTVWNNVVWSDTHKLKLTRYVYAALDNSIEGADLHCTHLMPAG